MPYHNLKYQKNTLKSFKKVKKNQKGKLGLVRKPKQTTLIAFGGHGFQNGRYDTQKWMLRCRALWKMALRKICRNRLTGFGGSDQPNLTGVEFMLFPAAIHFVQVL